jgi:hypothetical protein
MNRWVFPVLVILVACGGGSMAGKDASDPGGDPGADAIVFPETGGDLPLVDTTIPQDVPEKDTLPDPGTPCVPDCDKAGDRRCAPGIQGLYQVCEAGEGGCLRWAAGVQCPSGEACVAGECTAVCASDPGCTKAGDRRCSAANAYQECAEAEAGCFKLGTEQACPGSMACLGDGKCECVHACSAVGDRRCFGASPELFQECHEDAAGCRVWGEPAACEGDAVCKGAGVCEAVCTGDCPKDGDVECASGTQYRICMTVQPGCLKWGEPVACPGALTCDKGVCQVVCKSDEGCDTAGTTGCADAEHQRTCEEVLPGCIKWGPIESCGLHETCANGACACGNPCEADVAECLADVDPHFRKVCVADEGGCRFWKYEDCGGAWTCEAGKCVEICGSDPGCTAAGVTRCESLDSFSTCSVVEGHPDCIQFAQTQACADHQECLEATGKCACRVETGCTAAGTKRCVDYDNAATCTKDAQECLYWGVAEGCGEGFTCNAGTCGPICLSDLDCASAGTKRCTPDGDQQECVEIETGCLKWAPVQACPSHQACVDDTGCVCENPCKSGESRCAGLHQTQSCSAPDAAGCTFWTDPKNCDAADSCVQGECRYVVSPEVSCGHVTLNLVNQGYSEVKVSGNFQGQVWATLPMALANGVWSASVDVTAAGAYEYKFIADGTCVRDPLNPEFTGTPPMDNSVVKVTDIRTCETPGAGRCTEAGSLETCLDVAGCPAWKAADDPCTTADHYCDGGKCVAIASPVVTATDVTFTVRDQGFAVEVTGDFASPAWGAFVPLVKDGNRRLVTLKYADVPGLTPGQHAYKFHAPNGDYWFFDPANPDKADDGNNGFNSLLTVPPACASECGPEGKTRCASETGVQTCGKDAKSCLVWNDGTCEAAKYCLRDACEAFPVVDAASKSVTFVLPDDGYTSVHVAGSFTAPKWDETAALPMTLADGKWTAQAGPLSSDKYLYKYKLSKPSGDSWMADPHDPVQEEDGYGGFNSVFVIP